MKYVIKETVNHFHIVEIDDELENVFQDIVDEANEHLYQEDTGYEVIENILEKYQRQFGFEYKVSPNACGTDSLDLEIMNETY